MKFLNKKLNDCVQHIILQKFTNFHAIRSWSFQNIYNEIGWPRFLRHPVDARVAAAGRPFDRPLYERLCFTVTWYRKK